MKREWMSGHGNKSASDDQGEIRNANQAVEAVDSFAAAVSPGHCDMGDGHLESKKQSEDTEDNSVKSSSSFSSKGSHEQEKVTQSDEASKLDVLQTSPEDDVDESEVEEEDVKVCDICGDAGREDLLAVCSRCSDGAEHTYCMREMLDKVPEGDWICEECKLNEEVEARKQDHSKMLGTSERSKSVGRSGSINCDLSHKSDTKDISSESSKTKHATLTKQQVPSKRPGDSIESGATIKRQALESSIVSPKISSPGRIGALLKDTPFKTLDKAKRKSANQISSGAESTSDSSENVRSPSSSSLHAVKGNFLKSSSFSSANSKPNIRVPDEGSQKQKQGVDAKDGPGKLIGKSMSFKGLGRSIVGEPKVKMLSPKCAPVEESKCQKQARERISFERKGSIKLDHSFVGPTAANTTKRPFRGDNVLTSSLSNNGDHKNAQTDGKLPTMSKHAFHSVHKSSDSMAGSAEVKRQLSTSVCGSASVNGTNSSSELKLTHLSIKEGSTLSSCRTADRSLLGVNGTKADPLENQSEKSFDYSFGRSKQNVGTPMVGGNRRGLSSDASGSKVKEGIHEENKLKAAIEAAMQKKQDIFKKLKIPEKPIEFSVSSTQGNRAEDAVPSQAKDVVSEEAVHEGNGVLGDHLSNSGSNISTSYVKHLKVHPADFGTSIDDSAKLASAIPENESAWQGVFEIHRNGRLPDICGGFQAHLSSFASEKVLEVVKKFPHKLVFDEVTRPSSWPVKFKEVGAHEDNIALYFFAKDLDSYVRSYKILLDYLMKHDLALRGDINGVELLVFPSNQLPDKSQCWNSLFFMWGVFRGRKPQVVNKRSGSVESHELSSSNLIDKEAISSANASENPGLHRVAVEDLSVSGAGFDVSRCDASVSVAIPPSGEFYNRQCRVGRTIVSQQTLSENSQKAANDRSLGSVADECPKSDKPALNNQAHCYDKNIVIEQRHLVHGIDRGNHLRQAKKLASFNMPAKQDMAIYASTAPLAGEKEGGCVAICNHTDQVKCEDILTLEHGCVDNIKNNAVDVKPESDMKLEGEGIDCTVKNNTSKVKLESGLKKVGYVDINISAESNTEDFSDVCSTEPIFASEKRLWIDTKDASKREDQSSTNRTEGGFSGGDLDRLPSSFGDSLAAEMCSASTSSHVQDITHNKVDDEKSTTANLGSAQRYFFIVDSNLTHTEDESMSCKVDSSDNEDRLLDGLPNLELALGVEKKQSRKGILPFFAGIVDKNDPDRPPDLATSKEDEDASASLSLSLAFPFSDKERTTRIERPPTNVEQVLPGRHEVNAPLLFFRGSSGK